MTGLERTHLSRLFERAPQGAATVAIAVGIKANTSLGSVDVSWIPLLRLKKRQSRREERSLVIPNKRLTTQQDGKMGPALRVRLKKRHSALLVPKALSALAGQALAHLEYQTTLLAP